MKDLLFEKIINDINNIIVENLSISSQSLRPKGWSLSKGD